MKIKIKATPEKTQAGTWGSQKFITNPTVVISTGTVIAALNQ